MPFIGPPIDRTLVGSMPTLFRMPLRPPCGRSATGTLVSRWYGWNWLVGFTLSTIKILLLHVIYSARRVPSMRLLRLLVQSAELLRVGSDRAESGNLAALVEVFGIFDRQRLAFVAAGVELRSVELLFAVGKPNAIDRRCH